MALQEVLQIAERLIALEAKQLAAESDKKINEINERMSAQMLGSSTAILRAIADVYKKQIEDRAAKVGDVLVSLLNASQFTYFTAAEIRAVREFANEQIGAEPPETLVSAIRLRAIEINRANRAAEYENELASSQWGANEKLLARIDAYFLGKRDILRPLGKLLGHPFLVPTLTFVGGFLTRGCVPR